MATGVPYYPNGLPHPPMEVRRRILIELGVLILLTTLYLTVLPSRPMAMDIGMALVGLGLVGLSAHYTRERIWGPPADAAFERLRRCAINMTFITGIAVAGVAAWGIWDAARQGGWQGLGERFLNWRFLLALILYIPWALLQQTLFQFYLLGRLRALLPFASPLLLSCLNGAAYGLVHLALNTSGERLDYELVILTMIAGAVWSYSYHRDRFVLPIALSHAILGATFYYWARGEDILTNNVHILGRLFGGG